MIPVAPYGERLIKPFYIPLLVGLSVLLAFLLGAPAAAKAPEPSQEQMKQRHVVLVADAIKDAEGRCTQGLSGEQGCFQYQDATWRSYSTQVAGEVLTMTPENERMVTEGMISFWIDEGISDRGILLIWNQGSATGWGPGDKDCYAGVNSHGVPYDSCEYAKNGLEYIATHGSIENARPLSEGAVVETLKGA